MEKSTNSLATRVNSTQLTAFQRERITDLSEPERRFVEARFNSPVIKGSDPRETLKNVKDLIIEAIGRLGHYNSASEDQEKTIMFIATNVYQDILAVHKNFTLAELAESLRMLTRGDFRNSPQELLTVSASSVMQGIKAYLNLQERKLAFTNFNILVLQAPEKKVLKPEDIIQIYIDACARAWYKFKDTEDIPNEVVYCYEWIKKTYKFQWSAEEYEMIEAAAQQRIEDEKKGAKGIYGESVAVDEDGNPEKRFHFECRRESIRLLYKKAIAAKVELFTPNQK